jgi:hypothetical protein
MPGVVDLVLGQGSCRLSFVEDQQPIQAFAAAGADPPLGWAFAVGARGGLRSTGIGASANSSSKLAVNFASRSRTRNPKPPARSPAVIR